MIKLAVSPGDPAGIGPDICIKAFGLNKDLDFFPRRIWRHKPFQGKSSKFRSRY
ncbi:MAG: hypothetical protein CM1200mP12_04310 [Gammaproteobacteria bacterium]|nr:MAG: hypothetical protein CM1200mP12_04310 [Gammaproteobacteria bacterium]